MLWETPKQRRRFIALSLSVALGLPILTVGWLSLMSLLSGNGGVISRQDWGIIVLVLALSALPAMFFVVGIFQRRPER